MANKYIIHGEVYCGDGTSSTPATSTGGVGALNSLIYAEGTTWPAPAVLAAGDVVFLRSKDAAGADIVRTHAAAISLGSATATASAPITWVLDNGDVWPGIDGVLTYTCSAAYSKTILANNLLECRTKNALVLESTMVNPATHAALNINGVLRRAKWDNSTKTGVTGTCSITITGAAHDCHFIFGRGGSGASGAYFYLNAASQPRLVNCEYELAFASPPAGTSIFGFSGSYINKYLVLGGRVSGVGAVSGVYLATFSTNGGSGLRSIGLDYPKAIAVTSAGLLAGQVIESIGCDDGLGGVIVDVWGWATSRTDNNPPTLSAKFVDDAATSWAWRVFANGAAFATPVVLPTVKFYSDTANTRTITQEILVADTLTFTKNGAWIDLEYTDNSTGEKVYTSSKVSGSSDEIATSTANWTATTWGSVTMGKRKLSVSTPTAVKPGTQIACTFMTEHKGTNTDDIFFLDPDFSII